MKIKVNSNVVELCDASSVSNLVETLKLPQNGTAIAIGLKIIPRTDWDKTILNDGDEITVISAAYGG